MLEGSSCVGRVGDNSPGRFSDKLPPSIGAFVSSTVAVSLPGEVRCLFAARGEVDSCASLFTGDFVPSREGIVELDAVNVSLLSGSLLSGAKEVLAAASSAITPIVVELAEVVGFSIFTEVSLGSASLLDLGTVSHEPLPLNL